MLYEYVQQSKRRPKCKKYTAVARNPTKEGYIFYQESNQSQKVGLVFSLKWFILGIFLHQNSTIYHDN
jgi:hypothetical protein